ncbi:MAG: SDR family oxidoreductase [Candidatus Sulfobium sp.]|jgi:3-oxoacyl-[acyl-carrier protein] reductase
MRTALVTGASRGLGKEIALTLSSRGYRIAVNYLSSEKEALDVAERAGETSFAVRADVGDIGQVEEMGIEIERRFGRLDAVINNAGVTKDNLLLRQSEGDWDRTLRTNLKGCFNVIRAMAPIMKKSGGGHFLNVSSYSGLKGKAGQAAYSASKSALIGLSNSVARELAAHDIRVNVLLPGYMTTEMGAAAVKAMEQAGKDSISKKLSDPAEVAEFVAYLIQTKNITGQVFSLDSRII